MSSKEMLETHMMDRHLIYPPGFLKKRVSDWDADPSLRGMPVPIQGTNLTLDNPDNLKAWLEERRKRWPTSARVSEKKRKWKEAFDTGQFTTGDLNVREKKNWPVGSRTQTHNKTISEKLHVHFSGLTRTNNGREQNSSGDDQDYDAPEIMCSGSRHQESVPQEHTAPVSQNRPYQQGLHQQHRKQPGSSFVSKPRLLHKLLLPDIRMTVSNLSQATKFLVDNDFLYLVEEKPGAAMERKIQTI